MRGEVVRHELEHARVDERHETGALDRGQNGAGVHDAVVRPDVHQRLAEGERPGLRLDHRLGGEDDAA